MEKIDIHDMPAEPAIQVLNPDGSVLVSTDCTATFDCIRAEIKDNASEGHKIRTENGTEVEIDKPGRSFDKDDHIMTDCDTGRDEETKVIEDEGVNHIVDTAVGIV